MKILGIGNAIVDVICKVEDKYLSDNGLTKSTMKLVDEIDFKKLISTLKIDLNLNGTSSTINFVFCLYSSIDSILDKDIFLLIALSCFFRRR